MPQSVRLAVLLGASLLAACSPTAQRAKAVRFDVAADPASLNPLFLHVDASGVEGQLARLAFEPFFDLDERGRPLPALVREVPSVANGGLSADGRTIVYHLRRGVEWSDGVPVTAKDVLFTVRALRDPANPVPSREGYDLIESADAPDDFTVRFKLSRPWAPAVATFFTYGTSAQYVLPEHVLANQHPLTQALFNGAPSVGDGPFNFVSWSRGDRLVYAANLSYWRGRPRVDRVDVGIVPDPGTNLTLLQSGAIDFNLIAPAQQAVLANASGLAYAYVPTAIVAGIALNLAHPPLDDVRVRRALVQAIDRGAISQKVTLGRYPVADSDRPRFSWAYDPSVREPRYDPAAADAALDAAGWRRGPNGVRRKAGRELALSYVQFPESATGRNAATLVQRELHERGIGVTIKFISNAQLFLPAKDGGLLASGKFDLAYVPWFMGADPDDAFLYGCHGATGNYMRYCDPEVQSLEREAVAQPERERRRAAYVAIDRIVARDVPVIYLFNPTYVYAYRTRLHGFAPNAFVPNPNAYEWSIR